MNIAKAWMLGMFPEQRRLHAPKKIIELNITRGHAGDPVEKVMKDMGYQSGHMSPLVDMAIHPDYRAKVESYGDDAQWQAEHCRKRGGSTEEAKQWVRVFNEIQKVLGGSFFAYAQNLDRPRS